MTKKNIYTLLLFVVFLSLIITCIYYYSKPEQSIGNTIVNNSTNDVKVPQITNTNTQTPSINLINVTSTSTGLDSSISSPKMTATPYMIDVISTDRISTIANEVYSPSYLLDLSIDKSMYETPIFEYLDTDVILDPVKYRVSEIADNSSNTKRAFISCNRDNCQQKVYLEDLITETVLEVNWDSRLPSRPINRIFWIGEDVLVFAQATSPNDAVVFGLLVNDKTIVLHWLIH